MIKGIGASTGIGIGKIVIIQEQSLAYKKQTVENKESELKRYKEAVELFSHKTTKMAEDMKSRVGEKEAEILEGQLMMIEDPSMEMEVENLIQEGQCAEAALEAVCDRFIQMFSSVEDELTNQRVTDIYDIKTRMLKILLKIEEVDMSTLPANTVLVARDLTPSMTAGIHKENVVGILTEVGGKTSHSAILARALEITAVLSISNVLEQVKLGDMVIVDGSEGEVFINPDLNQVHTYTEKRKKYLEEKKALTQFFGRQTKTADGIQVELVANIGKPEDVVRVLECDGEGVGLFRTEFLFMDRSSLPSEEEQFEAYKKAAMGLEGKPIIIRTLDVGGDKEIPYLGLQKEENPFLGYRAVRFCLDKQEIYRSQLRALLRASAFGEIKIMVPLVTCLEELRSVKHKIEELKVELKQEGIAYKENIPVGVMIETPAASLIADILAKEADFFSIGTNDLTQYTMAVDRGNAKVAYLYSTYQPAVLRSIQRIIMEGKKAGIMVGMCGEAAAEPRLIPLLLSFGLEEFSVNPTSVLATRKVIAGWSKEEADKAAEKVMALDTEAEVLQCLEEIMLERA